MNMHRIGVTPLLAALSLASIALVTSGCRSEPTPTPTARPVPTEATAAPTASAAPPAPPPSAGPTGTSWGVAVDGLRLGVAVDGRTLIVHLENVGKVPLYVMSHISSHELQNDWLSAKLTDSTGASRTVAFDDIRDKSVAVPARIEPGKELVNRLDVVDWANRKRNGAASVTPLAAGTYRLTATYTTTAGDYASSTAPPAGVHAWVGKLESGGVTLVAK
jgi:hypothetical protein